MGDDHDGGAQAVAQLRIRSSSCLALTGSRPAEGSSKKRISGSRAMARARPARLFHAAADLRRVIVPEARKADKGELKLDNVLYLSRAQAGIFLQGQRDIFSKRHGAPQGAALIQNADAAHEAVALLQTGIPEVGLTVENPPLCRRLEPHEMAQQGAFSAAAAAHDDKNV